MAKEEKPIRVGIIGTGQIAQTHMKNYSALAGVEMVACADIDEGAARRLAETYKIPHVYRDYREVLSRGDIDAVDICLHNNYHMPATVAALEEGKHVYCEKPMAGSYRDAVTMYQAARRLDKKLHIQFFTLYSDETRAAKELIDLGELGELYHARSTGFRRRGRPYVDGYGTATFVQKQHAAGGALYDMGTYHIAQALYLLGNPQVVRVSARRTKRSTWMRSGKRPPTTTSKSSDWGSFVWQEGSRSTSSKRGRCTSTGSKVLRFWASKGACVCTRSGFSRAMVISTSTASSRSIARASVGTTSAAMGSTLLAHKLTGSRRFRAKSTSCQPPNSHYRPC